MKSEEKIKLCKVPRVLQYHVQKSPAAPKEYFHHQLLMHYHFRNEAKFNASCPWSYSEKYMNPILHDIIIANQKLLEPFVEFFDDTIKRITINFDSLIDHHGP